VNEIGKLVDKLAREHMELQAQTIEDLIINYLEYNPHLTCEDIELVCQDVVTSKTYEYQKMWWIREKNKDDEFKRLYS
jgi:hypothetical protein